MGNGSMSDGNYSLDYEQTEDFFTSAHIEACPSNIQGALCGLLCSGQTEALTQWAEELFSGLDESDSATQNAHQALGALFTRAREEVERAHGLTPFLPDDDQPLAKRAAALAEWCQGFLYGLGLSGVPEKRFSRQTRETLRDFSEISLLDSENLEEDEAGEVALTELYEYIRVACIQICDDLIPQPDAKA